MMRLLMAGLLVLGWAAAPAIATAAVQSGETRRGVDDPRAFIQSVYAAYARTPDRGPDEPTYAYSARLQRLVDAYEAAYAGQDLVGAVDFDLWTNAQEWSVSNVVIDEEQEGADSRTILVRFRNWDRENVNRFRFVREGGRWYLDDIVNGAGVGGDGWTFSALLMERE